MKTGNKNYGKLTVEEVIITELDHVRDIQAYMYLSDEERKQWRVYIVKKILSIRRVTSWIMTWVDLCMYVLIASAGWHIIVYKKDIVKYWAMAIGSCVIGAIVKQLMDHIEMVYIQKTSSKREKAVLEHFSVK